MESAVSLRCPSCAGRLAGQRTALRCERCNTGYPTLGGVLCLLPEPARHLDRWRAQLGSVGAGAEAAVGNIEAELRKPALLPKTIARLEQRRNGTALLRRELEDLLGPALGGQRASSPPVPPFASLQNLQIVFRDWGWPDTKENDEALACVLDVAHGPWGRTLVLGAGAGRLTYDLARRPGTTRTVAIDIDPLYLAVAARMMAGETLALTETTSGASTTHTLCAPHGAAPEIELLLADGLRPPIEDHSFDTIVTPWFIDQIPSDLRELVTVIRRILAPNGRWVSFGPAVYPGERPVSCRFGFDEILDLARLGGFDLERAQRRTLLYLQSPLEPPARLEPCLAFAARLTDGVANAASLASEPPSWAVFPGLPVPLPAHPSGQSNQRAGVRAIVELVDGQRSIDDIAQVLARRSGMSPSELVDPIRYALIEHLDPPGSREPTSGG